MSNALIVNGRKISIEIEIEQFDSIVRSALKEAIMIVFFDSRHRWQHEDDIEFNKRLIPALKLVYEYFAGEAELSKLEKEIKEIEEELNADDEIV